MPSSACQTCARSEEHTSELQSHDNIVCRLLLEKKDPTGRLLTAQSVAAGHDTCAVTRPPDTCPLRGDLLAVARGDVLDSFFFYRAADGDDPLLSLLGVPSG